MRNNVQGLAVSGLSVTSAERTIVEPFALQVAPGEMVALIGESGSGKSLTARAITGLLPRGVTATGTATIDEFSFDLASTKPQQWAKVRGQKAVLLLQDPFTSLSPQLRCGTQILRTIKARERAAARAFSRADAIAEVTRRLGEVRLDASVAAAYPSQLSGGMRQRVAIAAALAANPRLLIADEPTTALDASTQGEVLDLLRELQLRHEMSLMLISHDLGIVNGRADRVLVMQQGRVVEQGPTAEILRNPAHPYTQSLLAANPSILQELQQPRPVAERPVLTASRLTKTFGAKTALHDASLEIHSGEVLALVGESGSGKSTFAHLIAGLARPDSGSVSLDGRELPPGRRGRTPGEMQVVFQDPYATLNPQFTVRQTLAEAIRAGGATARTVAELLELVDLDAQLASRRPAQLSGGQRQRVAIARALAPNPRVLICDESVSALDVSVQDQILTLLGRLRDELGLAMLFITHDLGVVARIANRVIVLRDGEIVESGDTERVLRRPSAAYTQQLVRAAERDSVPVRAVSAAAKPTE